MLAEDTALKIQFSMDLFYLISHVLLLDWLNSFILQKRTSFLLVINYDKLKVIKHRLIIASLVIHRIPEILEPKPYTNSLKVSVMSDLCLMSMEQKAWSHA